MTNGTNTDFFATPVWFGLHDGSFDFFDAGDSASNALETIAELGDAAPLIADFEAAPGSPGDINGLVFGGGTGVPPIAPGETGIGSFEPINPANYQYFSFASMVVPTNDTFIGNDNALAYQIFDDAGNFLGTDGVFEIDVTRIYDAGTEVNDASASGGAAFAAGAVGTEGADENGVVTLATDLSEFRGLTTPNGFDINDTTLGSGQSFATIRIVEITGDVDFEGLARGTVVTNQIPGVSISAEFPDGTAADAMIFDAENPTGGDTDLGNPGQGNILIISEDGDSSDPDDNAAGGTLSFDFDLVSDVESLNLFDTEEGGSIRLYDADGGLIDSVDIPRIGNGDSQSIDLGASGVARMEIEFNGSGAVDDIKFH